MSMTFTEYRGKQIVMVDYRGCKEDEMISILLEGEKTLAQRGGKYLILYDVTDTFLTPEYMKVSKEVAKRSTHLTDKAAIVGVKGAKMVILKGLNLFLGDKSIKPFDTVEEAKDYHAS